jgi:hypothetical protein
MVTCTGAGDIWIHAGVLLEASGGLDFSTVFGLLAASALWALLASASSEQYIDALHNVSCREIKAYYIHHIAPINLDMVLLGPLTLLAATHASSF